MKKLFFLIFIVLCIRLGGIIDNCNSQWQWVNPKPNSNTVLGFYYADQNTIFMVQEGGIIMKSTNRGVDWFDLYSDSTANFGSFCFSDANTGMIAEYKNNNIYLIKTTNGGNNWNSSIYFNNVPEFSSLYLHNDTGYIGTTHSFYFKTTNRGISWDSVKVAYDSSFWISNIYFKNSNTGFATGWNGDQYHYWGRIFKTTNGGLNWTYVATPWRPCTLQFINDTGYVFSDTYNTYYLKTENLGVNWNAITSNVNQTIENSKFINSQTGFIVGMTDRVSISKTTNGGRNWQQSFPLGFLYLFGIGNYGTNDLITGGQEGSIIRTTNCGNNWISNTFYNGNFMDISFPNSDVGYAASQNSYIKTTNAGLNWIVDSIPYSYNLNPTFKSVKFINENTGFILKDTLYKTTNGGQDWNRINFGINRNPQNFSFVNENTGFAISKSYNYPNPSYSYLEKTTNGGLTWQETQYSNNIDIFKMYFFDEFTGYACYQYFTNTFLKTTNGGINWISINTNCDFRKIYFLNPSKGFLYGSLGLFLTTNGGLNFGCVMIDSSTYGFDINFTNENTGYYLDQDNHTIPRPRIHKTTNGGLNWDQSCTAFKNTNFDLVHFINDNTGFCFGTFGAIIKTTSGGGFTGVMQINSSIPADFILMQNYPNPFNPATIIKYSIPPFNSPLSKGGIKGVTLKVYDMLGREVVTLVNEKQSPGTYEVTFDARHGGSSSLASGIYFYKLTVSNPEFPGQVFSETKKLVLLK
jgi:photosystem II stability/assembly factor-like uncharacterized protein